MAFFEKYFIILCFEYCATDFKFEKLGNEEMSEMVSKLANSSGFLNPEDLLDNLNSTFIKPKLNGDINGQGAINLLKEFEEGKYWIDKENEVYISKKWADETDEVDVTIVTKEALVECKNLNGNNLGNLVNEIIKKYTMEGKLSKALKDQFPNHFGKISISNTTNEFYNLNKQQIINKFRQELLDQPGGIIKDKLIDTIQELHFENGQGRIIIKNTEW
ncbi:hypothetical protein [Chryseobacterium gambrini]|uniref:hypothetical protein n=1 Tax=Chryseobacterium gambrini TaxID=373672 RepID=UPI0022F3F999|nr:hypothetical protein [Chryseobacterium gambrini]WBX98252.1 hypothetical protein PE065_03110 [Chryseobacterium gambrini]